MKIKTILYFISVYRPILDIIRGAVRGIVDGVVDIHEQRRSAEEHRRFREDVLSKMIGPDDDSLTYKDM